MKLLRAVVAASDASVPCSASGLRGLEGNYLEERYPFYFLTDLPVTKRSVKELSKAGRQRWAVENEGFNTQKNHGYNPGHRFSRGYRAWKKLWDIQIELMDVPAWSCVCQYR